MNNFQKILKDEQLKFSYIINTNVILFNNLKTHLICY